jgi:hypothetical protein
MAKKSRWSSDGVSNGIWTIRLLSWKYFHDFVRQEMLDYSHYVWRGDRCDNRPLIPSFDRENHRVKSFILVLLGSGGYVYFHLMGAT